MGNILAYYNKYSIKKFYYTFSWGQCYKITSVNYCGNFNPAFCKVKIPW